MTDQPAPWATGGNYAIARPDKGAAKRQLTLSPVGEMNQAGDPKPKKAVASAVKLAPVQKAPVQKAPKREGEEASASPLAEAVPVTSPLFPSDVQVGNVPAGIPEEEVAVPEAEDWSSINDDEEVTVGRTADADDEMDDDDDDEEVTSPEQDEDDYDGEMGGGSPKKTGRPKAGQVAPNKVAPLIQVGSDDSWDEDNPAFEDGEMESDEARQFVTASRGVRITERDIDIIRFLARFRYAHGIQVARYVNSSHRAIEQRLTKLGKAGLLRREDVTKGQALWTPTAWGLSAADLDYSAIGAGKISYVTIAHTLGLVNLGIELETGGENVLGLAGHPRRNRIKNRTLITGETLITEREIRQAESRVKKALTRIDIEHMFRNSLAEWKANGSHGASPELVPGNEAMFVIWATKSGRSDHVPDLVVAGARDKNGVPGNHAIELELNTKSTKEWERILRTFADAGDLYAHTHYFTHKRTISEALKKIAKDVGLGDDRFSVHPYTPKQGGLPFWG